MKEVTGKVTEKVIEKIMEEVIRIKKYIRNTIWIDRHF